MATTSLADILSTQQRVLAVNKIDHSVSLNNYLKYFNDPLGQYHADELISRNARHFQFLRNGGHQQRFARHQGALWLQFTLANTGSRDVALVLESLNPNLTELSLYVVDPRRHGQEIISVAHKGLTVKGSEEAGEGVSRKVPLSTFPLLVPAQSTLDYYLQVRTVGTLDAPFLLHPQGRYFNSLFVKSFIQAVLIGLVLGLTAYNAFLYFSTRDRSYLYYVLSSLSVLAFISAKNGWLYVVWHPAVDWRPQYYHIIIVAILLFNNAFLRRYLHTRIYVPTLDKLSVGLNAYLLLVAVPTVIWGSQRWIYVVLTLAVVVAMFLIVMVALLCLRKGFRPAQYYLIANLAPMGIGLMYVLRLTLLEANISLVADILLEVYALQMVLFSLGLADRLNFLKEDRERSEQLTRSARISSVAKSYVLAQMSHELRTPLHGIIGISNLLQDSQLSLQQRAYVRGIHKSGRQLLRLVNDILDFSKLESRKVELEQLSFPVQTLVNEALAEYQPDAWCKVDLQLADSVDKGLIVIGDPYRLRQVLVQFLRIMERFNPDSELRLELKALPARNDVSLQFLIRGHTPLNSFATPYENNAEISARDVPQLLKGKSDLGVSISQRLLRLMGGKFGLADDACSLWFSVVLPTSAGGGENRTQVAGILAGKSVLVAENNPVIQMRVSRMLNAHSARPVMAFSAREAFKEYRDQLGAFDLLIVDTELASANGQQLIRKIRAYEHKQGLKKVPLVGLGAEDPDQSTIADNIEFSGYLQKDKMDSQFPGMLRQVLTPIRE